MIYFDNAATAPVCKAAKEAFLQSAALPANVSSPHSLGIAARRELDRCERELLRKFDGDGYRADPVGSASGSIIFTSGATESNHLAILGSLGVHSGTIVTTGMEHKSVTAAISAAAKLYSLNVITVPPPCLAKGETEAEFTARLLDSINERTSLVSCMAVNNETGFCVDTAALYAAVKRKNPHCLFHTDAAAGFAKTPVCGDLVSFSAHKFGGVGGAGGLYVRRGVRINPVMPGGGQQNGLRGGTEPLPLISAMTAAALCKHDGNFEHLTSLLTRIISDMDGVSVNYSGLNIVSVCVHGAKSQVLVNALSERGIYVSAGSACNKGKLSETLLAMGFNRGTVDGTLRVSFGRTNSVEEVLEFAAALTEVKDRFGSNTRKVR